ncbi:MAG: Stk1 family PASTA domain-containing Ser/Thr kinase [Actinomycetota bacterium]|nr:Stk1 family PASTA domain-containing Ser/Thr kinase [Actinomycetota bacterium]
MGDEALIGRVLDERYVIGQRIARGGMASVFMATDKRLDRVVAVKVMHSGMGDDRQFTERFVREARSAAKLNHANVVAVFDQGSDGDVTYLVMEYVPGNTLRDVMREECPMAPRRALALMEQILIALSAAHAAHIIHRDVKPENVLMTPTGEIKVADFGLARAVSAATTATGGTLIGTVSYLAPEIVVNDGADARSDVYACGALLYEMLTGLKPHAGESPIQVAYKHVHEDIAAPSATVPGIPPFVDALVARTTARDRDKRSADAHVMLQQVRQVLRGIDAGIADDPELTQDLLPRGPVAFAGGDAGDSEDTERVASAGTTTEVVSTGGFTAFDGEQTLHWRTDPAGSTDARPPGMHPVMTPERYKAVKKDQPDNRRGKILLIGAVALAVIAGLVGFYFGVGRYVDTPRLVGLSQEQAIAQAKGQGFTLNVAEREFSEDAPLGTVISTDPKPGAKILPQDTIKAVISKGKERYDIPQLKGMTLTEATAALDKLHLKVGSKSEKFDEKVADGDVVGTKLKTGTSVKRNFVVDLFISKGRQPVKVVNYTGKTEGEATKGLGDAGFRVGVQRAFSDSTKKGSVISQSPNSGTKFKNDTITIAVSKGPEFIKVPNVKGKKKNAAVKILEKAGFKVQSLGSGNFDVRSQSPGPDQKAKVGSTVTITPIPFG